MSKIKTGGLDQYGKVSRALTGSAVKGLIVDLDAVASHFYAACSGLLLRSVLVYLWWKTLSICVNIACVPVWPEVSQGLHHRLWTLDPWWLTPHWPAVAVLCRTAQLTGGPPDHTADVTFTFGAGAVKLPSAEAVLSSAQCASPVWPKVKVSS